MQRKGSLYCHGLRMLNRKGTKERHWRRARVGKTLCVQAENGAIYIHKKKVPQCKGAKLPSWGGSAAMEEEGGFSTLSSYKDNGTVVNC